MADYDAKAILAAHNPKFRTICEVHREIYENADNPEKVRELIEEAVVMAKKMGRKLGEYKRRWDAGMWAPKAREG